MTNLLVDQDVYRNGLPSLDERHKNSFDFLRFIAALGVLYSHHFPLSGLAEPTVPLFSNSYGGFAVKVFFVMSGFLIFNSLRKSQCLGDFLAARILRLMPNLVVALTVSSLIMMIYFDNYRNFYSHIYYIFYNSTSYLHPVMYEVDGVLQGRPNQSINGSLWTLQYEFFMYISLFAFFQFRNRILLTLLISSIIILHYLSYHGNGTGIADLVTFALVDNLLGSLGAHFMLGALVAYLWPIISAHQLIATMVAAACLIIGSALGGPGSLMMSCGLSLAVILIGKSAIFSWFGRAGDASYGIYIFAFPIQQLAIIAVDGFWTSMLVATVMTVAVGYATWHTFESRCLRHKSKLSARIRTLFRERATY